MTIKAQITVTKHEIDPALLDGLAREFGYKDKADLDAQCEAARAKLTPEQRELADALERDIQRRMLGL